MNVEHCSQASSRSNTRQTSLPHALSQPSSGGCRVLDATAKPQEDHFMKSRGSCSHECLLQGAVLRRAIWNFMFFPFHGRPLTYSSVWRYHAHLWASLKVFLSHLSLCLSQVPSDLNFNYFAELSWGITDIELHQAYNLMSFDMCVLLRHHDLKIIYPSPPKFPHAPL